MRSRFLRLALLLPTVLLLVACKNPLQPTGEGVTTGQLSGQVTAPPSQISAIGGFEAYRVAAFAGEVPVGAHARVQAYTLAGDPLPDATAQTDAEGRFLLNGVPTNQLSLLKATVAGKNGKSLTITGLVKPDGSASVAKVSAASTVVAHGLMKLGVSPKASLVTQILLDQVVEKLESVATEVERNPDLMGDADLSEVFQSALLRTTTLKLLVDKLLKADS